MAKDFNSLGRDGRGHPAGRTRLSHWLVKGVMGLLLALLLAGCAEFATRSTLERYHPTNIYRKGDLLPPDVRRVAILPLTISASTPGLEAGAETFGPVVLAEIQKSKRFEVVAITPEQLEQWTGRKSWRADEALPEDFSRKVQRGTGSDAILFCQLTRYAPYPPLELGWKFSLVTIPGTNQPIVGTASPSVEAKDAGGTFWSADEVFNAGIPSVARGARDFSVSNGRTQTPLADPTGLLSSPAQFGQYTLSTLFETIPVRELAIPLPAGKVTPGGARGSDRSGGNSRTGPATRR